MPESHADSSQTSPKSTAQSTAQMAPQLVAHASPQSEPKSTAQTAPQSTAQTATQLAAHASPQSESESALALASQSQSVRAAYGQLTPEVVAHLANLARIALTYEETVTLAGELGVIVDSVAKVSEVATPDVPATSHPIPLVNVFRNDVPGPTLTTEQALAGAPEHDGSRFKVSAILGEEQ